MWNKIQKTLLTLLSVAIIALLWMVWDIRSELPRTGYVVLEEVFKEFDMTKELQQSFQANAIKRVEYLDSLELNIRSLSAELEAKPSPTKEEIMNFNRQKEEYYVMKEEIEEVNMNISKEFDSQIYQQLNQYLSDFGRENGFTYIFGTQGTGTLMYASDGENVTQDVIVYINEKYSGRK
jgi:outer membrane protein